jgi:hypothetical protein
MTYEMTRDLVAKAIAVAVTGVADPEILVATSLPRLHGGFLAVGSIMADVAPLWHFFLGAADAAITTYRRDNVDEGYDA